MKTTEKQKGQLRTVPVCPACGMPRDEWQENKGHGYRHGPETYCCRGCAEGTGCTCGGENQGLSGF